MAGAAANVASAARYQAWRATALGRTTERLEVRLVFELAGSLAGKRVLDAGTGDGTYAIEAAARGARVTGIDSDPDVLAVARRRASTRGVSVEFREGRIEALPFADGGFDATVAVTVLCFSRDAAAAIHELARVLAPGGRLILGELGRFSLWAARRRARGWFGDPSWRGVRFWSGRELVSLVQQAGLRVAVVRGSVFYPPSNLAALALGPVDPLLGRLHAPGAAFLVVAADKVRQA
jgi:ubiquinone/menaquinone biosynthesis C-methylase UbiE